MNGSIVYVYIVVINDGFYMEDDITISRVFLNYKPAKKYCDYLKKSHKCVYILKRKLFY